MSTEQPIKVKIWDVYIRQHSNFTGCLIDKDNDIAWYKNGLVHRENAPAIEFTNGDKEWWLNGNYHRENGPAIERADGRKEWWLNGQVHRVDGPAIERPDGSKQWCLKGTCLTEQDHRLKVRQMKLKMLDIGQYSL